MYSLWLIMTGQPSMCWRKNARISWQTTTPCSAKNQKASFVKSMMREVGLSNKLENVVISVRMWLSSSKPHNRYGWCQQLRWKFCGFAFELLYISVEFLIYCISGGYPVTIRSDVKFNDEQPSSTAVFMTFFFFYYPLCCALTLKCNWNFEHQINERLKSCVLFLKTIYSL